MGVDYVRPGYSNPLLKNKELMKGYYTVNISPLQYGMPKTMEQIEKEYKKSIYAPEKAYTISNTRKDAKELYTTGKDITNKKVEGVFQSKAAVVGDESKISAKAKNGAYDKTYKVEVEAVAKKQVNKGNDLQGSKPSVITQANYSFSIQKGNSSKEISFNVGASDNNEGVLGKMAKSINDSKIGIAAKVEKDEKTGMVSLKMTSEETGKEEAYQIVDKEGDSIAKTGISKIEQAAQNAKYKVDGKAYEAKSNEINLDDGRVSIELKEPTKEAVNVTIKSDTNKITHAVNKFAESYNKIVSSVSRNELQSNTVDNMVSAIKKNSKSLKEAGITLNSDHTLSIDQKKLQSALENNFEEVKKNFTGYQGAVAKLTYGGKAISDNPMVLMGEKSSGVYSNGMSYLMQSQIQGSFLNKVV